MHKWLQAIAFALAVTALSAAAQGLGTRRSPDLGVEIDAAAAWGETILANGFNLPEGSGNAAEGEEIYRARCAACHDAEPRLTLFAGKGSLSTSTPIQTVISYWPYATTVFDYIRRAMPYESPHSLADDEVYGLTAYILVAGGLFDGDAELDRDALITVEMPNKAGFIDRSMH